jgi:hypothetical protein
MAVLLAPCSESILYGWSVSVISRQNASSLRISRSQGRLGKDTKAPLDMEHHLSDHSEKRAHALMLA